VLDGGACGRTSVRGAVGGNLSAFASRTGALAHVLLGRHCCFVRRVRGGLGRSTRAGINLLVNAAGSVGLPSNASIERACGPGTAHATHAASERSAETGSCATAQALRMSRTGQQ
jgi:hypothetical protein